MIASDLLKHQTDVRHGFFTRRGGVSEGIYHSLNCGFGSGDASQNVRKNRLRVAAKLGIGEAGPLTVRQVHGNRAVVADSAWQQEERPEADALVTAERGLGIAILTADCTPILFADAEAGVAAAAHAGWRGAKTGIIEATIEAMEGLGARRERIHAAIGPTISQKAYEVGKEFQNAFLEDGDANGTFFARASGSGKPHFDLPAYCGQRLSQAGIGIVDDLGLCTYGNESLFYSYRRSVHRGETDYGRQISAIVLM
jgi:YfiH family protein